MVCIAVGFHLFIEMLEHIRKPFHHVDAIRRDVDGLDVLGTILPNADAGDVDRPAVGYIAQGVGNRSRQNLLPILPIDHYLYAAWVDIDARLRLQLMASAHLPGFKASIQRRTANPLDC